ncbi:MAG: Invasion associated locus B family protein [Rhizobiales bacterium]|nr:Invasion associated locus B family protein [Hyphomicrobiales bacterium]
MISLLVAAAYAFTPAAPAQGVALTDVSSQASNTKSKSEPAKRKPAAQKKPPAKPATSTDSQAAVNPSEPTLMGQFGDWGAYTAAPGGKKVCFALSKPKSQNASKEDVKRDQAYMFIATRPTEKVKEEVSIIVGYPLNTKADATAQVGSSTYLMFGQNDGAWIKNAAEEPQLLDSMRKGSEMVVKAKSTRGTETTDTYSLKGVSNALDRVAKECGDSG